MLLKVAEVAALLRVSKSTVRKLCETGLLRAVKLSQRGTRIDQASVDDYLRRASSGEVTILATEATPGA